MSWSNEEEPNQSGTNPPTQLREKSDLELSFDRVRSMIEALSAGEQVSLIQIKAAINDMILFDLKDSEKKNLPLVDFRYSVFKGFRKSEYERVRMQYPTESKRRLRIAQLDYEVMTLAVYETLGDIKAVIEARRKLGH
jgi:hypothetical protein